jgi:hypothetical protein
MLQLRYTVDFQTATIQKSLKIYVHSWYIERTTIIQRNI